MSTLVRRMILCSVGGLLLATPMAAQERLVGAWSGELDVGVAQLRLVLHLERGDEGYAASLDSPDQGAFGIRASDVEIEDISIDIGFADLAGRYTGSLDTEGERLVGKWSQAGQVFSLVLARGVPEPVRRPQDPEPPLPYRAEDVTFAGGAPEVELAGTLTLPPGEGPHAAAILVSGSGPQDRNAEIFRHRPFLVLADYLTRRGVAVLRYDDRGVAESTGQFATATTEDFAADVAAAVTFLRSRVDIAPGSIGLIGHSEGGLVAPLVASRMPLAWIVMLAGPGLPGDSVLALQIDAMNRAAGLPETQRAANRTIQRRLMDIAMSDLEPPAAQAAIADVLLSEIPGTTAQAAEGQAAGLTSPWMRAFLRHDPRPVLCRLTVPVLAVNGENDLQVLARPNLEAIESALVHAGNADFAVVEFEGLNHLLQTSETGLATEYGRIEETIAPRALEAIGDWITARSRT